MASFTSAVRIKRLLGIPAAVTRHDTLLDELAAAADYSILEYTGQAALTSTMVTDGYDIERAGQDEIMLRNFPVAGISSVVHAGVTMSASEYTLDSRTGAVRLTAAGATYEQGRQKVTVEYRIGFEDGSPQLNTVAHAATVLCASWFNAHPHAGMRTEGQGAYRYTTDPDEWPAPVRSMLSSFIRIIPRDSSP